MANLKQIDMVLNELVTVYTNPLLKYCYGILCNHTDAEDAVQMTFIKFYQNYDSFDPNKGLKTYLYKIAYHTSIDILRKNKRTILFGNAQYEEAYIETGYHREFPDELKKSLLSLKPLDRGLVVNRVVHEMSYHELSELYDKPEAYLRKRFERARNKMENFFSQNLYSDQKGVCNE